MKTVLEFRQKKQNKEKISMVTCYDFSMAQIMNKSTVDCILVGDSSAMVMHGYPTTISATIELITTHAAAVARGAPDKFIVGDLPFLSYRQDLVTTMKAVISLMQAGCHAVKLEGARGNEKIIHHIVESGVPVMGHLGLTPQLYHQLGGFRVQGKEVNAAQQLREDASIVEKAGCFATVLECIPAPLAQEITANLTIPTIGIGAGPHVDGQVLVLQDLLGMNSEFKPRFVKKYLEGEQLILKALNQYQEEVKKGVFPSENETFK